MWQLVPRPTRINIIDSKWVYLIETKENETINHFKARLVTKGFKQVFGLNYEETFNSNNLTRGCYLFITELEDEAT